MNTKINSTYFNNGLKELDIESIDSNIDVLDVVNKINNMQLQSNDVKDIIGKLILGENIAMDINYNDVKSVLTVEGGAFIAIAYSKGEWATTVALNKIISTLTKRRDLKDKTTMLINVVGKSIGIFELNHAFRNVIDSIGVEPEVYLGITPEESLDEEVYAVAIVTGL